MTMKIYVRYNDNCENIIKIALMLIIDSYCIIPVTRERSNTSFQVCNYEHCLCQLQLSALIDVELRPTLRPPLLFLDDIPSMAGRIFEKMNNEMMTPVA
jgi:hypothetical protein